MYTLISIFYISLIVMAVMILFKRHEVKTGKRSIVSEIGRGSDHVFQAVFGAVRRALSYLNRRTFIAIAHWIAYHVLLHVRRAYIALKAKVISTSHGKRLLDAVRGRGDVKKHGASFYLRRISAEHRAK